MAPLVITLKIKKIRSPLPLLYLYSMKFKILLIIFLATSCYEVQRDCNSFRTGTFESEIILNEVLFTSTFKRTESLQVEYFRGQVDSASVRWINDCEMIFKTINPKT